MESKDAGVVAGKQRKGDILEGPAKSSCFSSAASGDASARARPRIEPPSMMVMSRAEQVNVDTKLVDLDFYHEL